MKKATGLDDRKIEECLAEHVLGWKWQTCASVCPDAVEGKSTWLLPPDFISGLIPRVPRFLTNLNDAFRIANILMAPPYNYECYLEHQTSGWSCVFKHPGDAGGAAYADTIERAICCAALVALGHLIYPMDELLALHNRIAELECKNSKLKRVLLHVREKLLGHEQKHDFCIDPLLAIDAVLGNLPRPEADDFQWARDKVAEFGIEEDS